jgi:Fic family protein
VRLHAELPRLVPVIGTAPAQALARMHALVARGFADEDALGRPRGTAAVDDALRLGTAPSADAVADRLAGVGALLRESAAPGVLVAAVVHAEVASMRPFGWGSGLVARALLRLVLAQRGVDPSMMAAPEVGLRAVGRPQYVRALRGYAAGTPQGVAELLVMLAGAVAVGAREAQAWPAVPGAPTTG